MLISITAIIFKALDSMEISPINRSNPLRIRIQGYGVDWTDLWGYMAMNYSTLLAEELT